jgi:Fe2+ or Zn2+ uptake regulation protein
MSTEQARARLQNRIDILEASNQTRIKFADLADLPEEVGRGRGWVYQNLGLLVQAGRLKEIRPPEGGVVYEIVKRYPQAG